MPTQFYTVPQVVAGQSILPRNIFTTVDSVAYGVVPGGYIIDGTKSRDTGQGATSGNSTSLLRTGLLMGKITTGGKYRPSIIGVLNSTTTTASTSLTLAPAVATEIQRLITLNGGTGQSFIISSPATAGGSVVNTTVVATSAVTGASGTSSAMILSSSINAVTVIGGIVTPSDGSQTPLTVLCENPFGVDVTDVGGTSIDQYLGRWIIKGDFLVRALINFVADDYGVSLDTSVEALLKTRLKSTGNQFTFSDDR